MALVVAVRAGDFAVAGQPRLREENLSESCASCIEVDRQG